MKNLTTRRYAGLIALLALAACDDTGTAPEEALEGADTAIELAILSDEDAVNVATELADVAADVAVSQSRPGSSAARGLADEARAAFRQARASWRRGALPNAVERARVARRLVARALIATGGRPAVEDLIERLEDLASTLDEELVDDPEALRAELEDIVAEARALLEAGDTVGAAARALLGEQRARLRRGAHDRPFAIGPDRARLEVAFATASVALAERLIASADVPTVAEPDRDAGTDVADRQNRWLAHAARLLARAEMALENGRFPRAVHLARHAQWSALKAVVLPGGITREEVAAMIDVASTLHEQATAAVGEDDSELRKRVLARAGSLLDNGVRRVEAGQLRGVAALWRSATMSAWLIG